VIIVTHDMRILEGAENIVSMSDGRIMDHTTGPRSEAA
jgi:ABC-type lipoprotein export system ATPase subunit